ncbi:MAG TPA: hypothetical protein VE955_07285 [Candidatus Dormibacteraeota bacterium]|nr:hypothetical protein [Candidatus Dormibacteraeota bacterium]
MSQQTLEMEDAGYGVVDITSGLYGMQREIRTWAGLNIDASVYRKVDVRADFTKLPLKPECFETVLFDPPHTIDTRNTLLGTMIPNGGLGPHLASYKYGCYRSIDQLSTALIEGSREAYRILKPRGTMIFKWSESEKPFSWAHDRVRKPGFDNYNLKLANSRAHTGNRVMYTWYRKLP